MKLLKISNKIFSHWPIFFLALIVAIFGWKFLFLGHLPIPADTIVGMYHPWRDQVWDGLTSGVPFKNFLITDPVRQLYPWRFLAIENLKNGIVPNWNPYSFSGTPLLANFQSAAFYPLNLLFWLFRFNTAWAILILLQPLLAGVFNYFYLRELKLSQVSSLIGSLCFSFSGFSIAWLEWGTIGHTLLWLPLILLSVEKLTSCELPLDFARGRRVTSCFWFLVLIFSLVASFFAGHLQTFFYVLVFSFVYLLWKLFQLKSNKFKHFLLLAISFLLFAIITSVQWLPTLKLINLSARGVDQLNWQNPGWFIPWQHLAQFFAPDFFGNPSTLNYWGIWNYGEFVGYIGVIPLLFAFYAILSRRSKYSILYSLYFILFLSFALPTPWAKMLYQLKLPFLSTSQPTRLLGVVDFCLVVLAAFGFESILKNKAKLGRLILPTAIFVLLWIFTFLSHLSVADLAVARRNLVLPTGIFVCGSVLIYLFRRKHFPRLFLGLLLVIICFDLLRFSWKFMPFVKTDWLFPPTKVIDFLKQDKDVFRIMTTDRRIFPPNFSIAYKIQAVDGYDPLYLRRYGELVTAWERDKPDISPPFGFNRIITPQNYQSKIADLLNVKYILSLTDLNSLDIELVFQEGETRVYKNKDFLPRAFIVYNYQKAKDKQEAVRLLMSEETNLSREVILEEDLLEGLSGSNPSDTNEVVIERYEENSATVRVKLPQKGILILTDSYYPGWEAKIDNQQTRIYLANYNFRAIVVPEGEHKIIFRYGN